MFDIDTVYTNGKNFYTSRFDYALREIKRYYRAFVESAEDDDAPPASPLILPRILALVESPFIFLGACGRFKKELRPIPKEALEGLAKKVMAA